MAENYHLKWDSHLSFLNSSVATLYKNEKFADVVLYSSSSSSSNGGAVEGGIPTVGISAHKFILSSCSQFFATIFETAPISAPNGVLYVVLPPDLSHRAIQILVQYMYSGEATVSNDILSEVLRGGEILKIRGLCRTSSTHHRDSSTNNSSSHAHYSGANSTRSSRPLPPVAHTHLSSAQSNDAIYASNKCSATVSSSNYPNRYALDHTQPQPQPQQPQPQLQSQHHHQFRGLGVSVMPKDSPVIVKSPKMIQMGLMAANSKQHTGCISVNKEVAIDPDGKCCYQVNQHVEPLQPILSQTSICGEVGCSSCPMSVESEQMRLRQRSQSQEDEIVPTSRLSVELLEREYSDHPPDEHCERPEVSVTYERRLSRGRTSEQARDYFMSEPHYEHGSVSHGKQFIESTNARLPTPPHPHPHPHNFLAIKQEPSDWTTSSTLENSNEGIARVNSPLQSPKQPLDFKMPLGSAAVKLEAGSTHNDNEQPDSLETEPPTDYTTFTRLTCEVCKKSFDNPKSWVRHMSTHGPVHATNVGQPQTTISEISSNGETDAITKSYVPKKRRRVSQQENNLDHVTLLCDLCSTSFETPAEWVRHMNNQHTEIELAMFNSKKDSEQKNTTTTGSSTTANSVSSNNSHHNQSYKKYSHRATLGLNYTEHSDRTCNTCNKKFPSHSNMVSHRRCHSSVCSTDSSTAAMSPTPPGGAHADVTNAKLDKRNSTSPQA